jgi:hypothetical protein
VAARNRIRFGTLLLTLVLVIGGSPFLRDELGGLPLSRLTFSALFFAGVYAVSRNRRVLMGGALVGVPALVVTWLSVYSEGVEYVVADHMTDLAFIVFVGSVILRTVVAQDEVTADTIYGGICVYLLIGLGWEAVYSTLEYLDPGSFAMGGVPLATVEGADAATRTFPALVYYSFVTLTTLGYGDIVPTTPQARVLSTAEAIFGQLFVAIFIARLVGLQLAHARAGGNGGGQSSDS